MNSGRIMNLLVTIPAESRRMNVGKDVIRVLGSPAYICVLQRKDRKSIAITPCAAEHPMSFKVPGRLLTDGQCRNGDPQNYWRDALVAFNLNGVVPDTEGKTVKLTIRDRKSVV